MHLTFSSVIHFELLFCSKPHKDTTKKKKTILFCERCIWDHSSSLWRIFISFCITMDLPLLVCLSFSLPKYVCISFFFFFFHTCNTWKFPDQGSNLPHSSDQSLSSENTGSFTPCAARELFVSHFYSWWLFLLTIAFHEQLFYFKTLRILLLFNFLLPLFLFSSSWSVWCFIKGNAGAFFLNFNPFYIFFFVFDFQQFC